MINNLRKMKVIPLLVLLLIIQWSVSAQTTEQIKNEVWQRELQYWKYVEKNDTTGYKTLWHKDFIKDKNLKYSHALHKKAVNVVVDVAMTFYDEDDILTNKNTGAVTKDTYKITHTWKKFGNTWLIIGGMAGYKQ